MQLVCIVLENAMELDRKKIKNKIREFHFKNMALIHNSDIE